MTCQSFQRTQQREPLTPNPVPDRVWQNVSADIFTLDGKDYFIVTVYYSHISEIVALENKTASCVITHLKSLFARYGIEEVLMSTPNHFAISPVVGILISYGLVHLPQSNGITERAVQTVKMLLRRRNQKANIHTSLSYSIAGS